MKYNQKPTVYGSDKKYLIKCKNSYETYYRLAHWDNDFLKFYDYDQNGEPYQIKLNEDDEWFDADVITKANPYSLENVLKLVAFDTTVVLHDQDGNRICTLEMLNNNSKLFESIMSCLGGAIVTEIDRGKNDYEIILELDV